MANVAGEDGGIPLDSPIQSKSPSANARTLFNHETDLEPAKRFSLGRKSWYQVSTVLGLLWLAPAVALMTLNIKGHIIGSSLGCRGVGCNPDRFAADLATREQNLDKQDHEILGALQIVAKVLDSWFLFVATSLAYNLTLHLASHEKGLPIGQLTKHLEFPKIGFILDEMKDCVKHNLPCSTGRTSGNQRHRQKLGLSLGCGFILTLICLCFLVSLMGPATAILAIPTLQWIDREHKHELHFEEIASSTSPRVDIFIPSRCNATQFASGNFSCTRDVTAPSLDAWIANSQASNRQAFFEKGTILPSVFQEQKLSSSVNLSYGNDIQWIPNRSVLGNLSEDYDSYLNLTSSESFDPTGFKGYSDLNSSLQTRLQREGPTVGVKTICYNSIPTILNISQDKSIRCYHHTLWDADADPSPTAKCIPWGSGWDVTQAHARFSVADVRTSIQQYLAVEIFMTDRVAFLDGNSKPDCFISGLIDPNSTCDWNEVFSDDSNKFAKSSVPQQTFEYSIANSPNTCRWCDANYTLGFATYVLNPSSQNNLLNLVELQVFNDTLGHLEVHPDWLLAAWAVDRDGSVGKSRAAAITLTQSFVGTLNQNNDSIAYRNLDLYDFFGVHLSSISQAVSMITYSYFDAATSPLLAIDKKRHRKLRVWASGQLWKFGLESRTSKGGTVVVAMGCLIVLFRTFCHRWSVPSPLELIMEALHHGNGAEFDSVARDSWSAVEFRIGQEGDRFSYGLGRYQSLSRRYLSSGSNTLSYAGSP